MGPQAWKPFLAPCGANFREHGIWACSSIEQATVPARPLAYPPAKSRKEKRLFTFTSLPGGGEHPQFSIESYQNHDGATEQIAKFTPGDLCLIGGARGVITHKGTGAFIASEVDVTPFTSIFKTLELYGKVNANRLIFSNKTKEDIILQEYWEQLLGENFISVLTEGNGKQIDQDFLEQQKLPKDERIYLSGPPAMVEDLKEACQALGLDTSNVVLEE